VLLNERLYLGLGICRKIKLINAARQGTASSQGRPSLPRGAVSCQRKYGNQYKHDGHDLTHCSGYFHGALLSRLVLLSNPAMLLLVIK
jgi:hypothetical protein